MYKANRKEKWAIVYTYIYIYVYTFIYMHIYIYIVAVDTLNAWIVGKYWKTHATLLNMNGDMNQKTKDHVNEGEILDILWSHSFKIIYMCFGMYAFMFEMYYLERVCFKADWLLHDQITAFSWDRKWIANCSNKMRLNSQAFWGSPV